MARITLVGVAKAFNDKQILDRLDLDIENGELIALLGPSGSGKTTLLKLIAGLDTPSAGRIEFDGSDVTLVSTRHRQAIIVFQDHCLFPHLTVKENIAFGLRARNEPRATIDRKVGEILEVVQLPGRQNSLPHALSGGEKQRIALARACVLKPRALLLDEPFSNLDVNLRLSMREFVVSLQRVLKLTCVLVTHDKEEAFVMAERVAVLLDGRLEQVDTPENLYDRPKNKKVAEFLGEANFFPGVMADGVFSCALGSFTTPWQDTRQAVGMVRYDNVQLRRHTGNALGKIKDKVFAGRYTFYKVALAAGGELMASCKESFAIGDTVYVSCADHAMQVYRE